MAAFALLVLLAAPERGIIPLDIVRVEPLKTGARGGTPEEALETWVEGHRLHEEGEHPAACARYLEFLAMSGHRSLPARYAKMARERVEAFHEPVQERFEDACKAYPDDRRKALAVFRELAATWGMLPEGYAALQLWQSDALREAIDRAKVLRDTGKGDEAKGPLEKAVRSLPEGLYRYEATTLLVELGGPDLRAKKWKEGSRGAGEPDSGKPEKEDEESIIEIND